MNVLVLAAALGAAAGAGAQEFAARPARLPVAPALAAWAAPSAGARLPAAPAPLAAPPSVIGVPGPGVSPARLEAVQRLADATDRAWFVHGTLGTLGAIGPAAERPEAVARLWDGAGAPPGRADALASVEEAAARGHLVVTPRRGETSGALAAARALGGPARTAVQLARLAAAPRAPGETFRFTVIGDAEPGRFWFSRALFNPETGAFWRLLARADRSGSDFIVQLGDMVSRGLAGNFADFLRRWRDAALRTPYLTVIGNHDRRSPHGVSDDHAYRAVFGGTNYAFDRGGWRFVAVDTSAGRLLPSQLAWLREAVPGDRPTVVFTHMPPAPLGEWTDFAGRKGAGGFRVGAEEFMRLMSERGVRRVYMGHVHGFGVLDRGGVRYGLTGGGGSPLFPGPVKDRFHHALTVEAGPDGLAETVHPLRGAPYPLR